MVDEVCFCFCVCCITSVQVIGDCVSFFYQSGEFFIAVEQLFVVFIFFQSE